MLTGDNKTTAEAVRKTLGIDEAIAEVMPDEKEKHIRSLMESGMWFENSSARPSPIGSSEYLRSPRSFSLMTEMKFFFITLTIEGIENSFQAH